jgi:heme-degrading monooxygenase HmoA
VWVKLSFEIPYYAVIFTSLRKMDAHDYNQIAERMEQLSRNQSGFLGIQSVREDKGLGITVSYWKNIEDVLNWKMNVEHREAQSKGKSDWYKGYEVRICKVEREYDFGSLDI